VDVTASSKVGIPATVTRSTEPWRGIPRCAFIGREGDGRASPDSSATSAASEASTEERGQQTA